LVPTTVWIWVVPVGHCMSRLDNVQRWWVNDISRLGKVIFS
jgi:hypothetical protein